MNKINNLADKRSTNFDRCDKCGHRQHGDVCPNMDSDGECTCDYNFEAIKGIYELYET